MGGWRLRSVALPLLLLGMYAAVFGTIFGTGGGGATAPLVAAVGWPAAIVGLALARRLWADVPLRRMILLTLAGFGFSVVAAYVGFLLSYGISISAELCGEGASSDVAFGLGAAAYAAIGTVLARTPRALLWAWPLAVVVGVGVQLLFDALLPGAHGFCET